MGDEEPKFNAVLSQKLPEWPVQMKQLSCHNGDFLLKENM